MKRHIVCFFILVLTMLTAYGSTESANRSFTNADLERYKGDSTGVIIPETISPAPAVKQKPAKKVRDGKSKQYWCSKGSAERAKVDRVKTKVTDAEQKLAGIGDQPRKKKSRSAAEKKVRSAKKELYQAEQELNDLEQSAHRQNIPPGWLRCQFSY